MTNILCRLLGHRIIEPTAGVELCERCGDHAAYYDDGWQWSDRERYGLVEPLRVAWRWVRNFTRPRCANCGKSLWFRKRYQVDFCCWECFDKFVPF